MTINPDSHMTRRKLMSAGAIAGGALLLGAPTRGAIPESKSPAVGSPPANGKTETQLPSTAVASEYSPVITPNGATLPWKLVDGAKVFHLTASEFDHEFAQGLVARCWGYNGRTPGPTIEAVEGDRVRFYVTNKLPEPTTVHWHGLEVPNGMDGVSGLTQPSIAPGKTFRYEFALTNPGTFMYHPHFDEMTQMGMGMMGMFVVHPRTPVGPRVDRDFAIMLSEWRIDPGSSRPNPSEMTDFNILTMNSRAFPGTDALVVKKGDRVRIRFGNLGAMEHHPIHLHGHQFTVTETDGGLVPASAQFPANTVLVPVGTTRAIEFIANNPGDWPMHCHMTHHTMNQMGHGLPNMLGVDTKGLDKKINTVLPQYMSMGETGMGEMAVMNMGAPKNSIPMIGGDGPMGYIDMGGMFTIVKIREGITSYENPGWYHHPEGSVAREATPIELVKDGILSPPPPG
jgi:manganese oxidase